MERKKIIALGLGVFAVIFSGAMIAVRFVVKNMNEKKDMELANKVEGINTSLRKEE